VLGVPIQLEWKTVHDLSDVCVADVIGNNDH
jgi:hypothetical protein